MSASNIEWIEIVPPIEPRLAVLAGERGIHPLAVEDCLHLNQRSKLEDFGRHRFLVIHAIQDLDVIESHFIVFSDAIIQSSSALDIYWGWTSKLVNDQMERLTALAAIFIPLTFWTGFFGTNFQIIPYHSKRFFLLAMAAMTSTVFIFYVFIQKRGYFGRVRQRRRERREARVK